MSYETRTVDEFLDSIASEAITPAGGTAAAVVGAVGASLCEMVCIHTVESGGDGDGNGNENENGNTPATADLSDARDELRKHRRRLLGLADADATVVDELFSASDGDPDQSAVKRSIGVPLTVAEACLTVVELAVDVAKAGNRNAVPDAATGVFLAGAALRASVFTARTNLDMVSDPSFVDEIERRTTEAERRAEEAHERVMRTVEDRT